MSITHAQAARATGMKEREIHDVVELDEGYLVTTFDGQQTLLLPGGGTAPAPATGGDGDGEPAASKPAGKTSRSGGRGGSRQGRQGKKNDDAYPVDGDTAAKLAWIGQDGQRAAAAAEAEAARGEDGDTEVLAAVETLLTH